ncbi:hypothetical protein Bhyg_02982, partial [Pseudolycoriella hygida]
MEYARVELKYEQGKFVDVRTSWILNFNPKFKKIDDFLCYWSSNLDEPTPDLECGYSQHFTGTPSLFKVYIVCLGGSLDEINNKLNEKRAKIIPKRFREAGNTDVEMKQLLAKKTRSEKKELKACKAMGREINSTYFSNLLNENIEKGAATPVSEDFSVEEVEDDHNETSNVPLQYNTYEEIVAGVLEENENDYSLDTNFIELIVTDKNCKNHSDKPEIEEHEFGEKETPSNHVHDIQNGNSELKDSSLSLTDEIGPDDGRVIVLNFDEIIKSNQDITDQL